MVKITTSFIRTHLRKFIFTYPHLCCDVLHPVCLFPC